MVSVGARLVNIRTPFLTRRFPGDYYRYVSLTSPSAASDTHNLGAGKP